MLAEADNTVVVGDGAPNTVTNEGTFEKLAGSSQADGTSIGEDVFFRNLGTVNVKGGHLSIVGGGNATGTFNIAAGTATLDLWTYTLNAGAQINGGTLLVDNGTLNSAGTINAKLEMTDAAITGNGGLSLTADSTWSGGAMSGGGTTVVPQGITLNIPAPVALNNRILDVAGTVAWTGPLFNLDNGATVKIENGGLFDSRSDGSMNTSTLTSGPVVTVEAGGTLQKALGNATTAINVPVNASGGTVQALMGKLGLRDGGSLTNNIGGPLPNNAVVATSLDAIVGFDAGNFSVDGGTSFGHVGAGEGTFSIGAAATVTANGTISIPNLSLAGTLTVPTVTLTGNCFLGDGAQLNGGRTAGTGVFNVGVLSTADNGVHTPIINGNFTNKGILSPGHSPGKLVNGGGGSCAVAGGSQSIFQIGGPGPGTGYDQLETTGSVQLNGGVLKLALINGYIPPVGQTFTILANDLNQPINGVFKSPDGTDLPEGSIISIPGTDSFGNQVSLNFLLTYAGQFQDPAGNTTTHNVVLTCLPDHLRITGPNSASAGVPFYVTVSAFDVFGNTASGYRGTVQFGSNDPSAVLPAKYTFTGADQGVHVFTATLFTAGVKGISVTDAGDGLFASLPVTVSAGPTTKFMVIRPTSARTAGVGFDMTLRAFDAYGNFATGYTGTVHFSSSDPQAMLPANYTFSAADQGVHTFINMTALKTAGSQTITVADTANGALTDTETFKVVAAAPSHFVVSGPTAARTAGVAFAVTVTALDPFGNVATQYRGTVHFGSTDTQASLPGDYPFNANDKGVHTFAVTLKTSGQQTVTVSDTQSSSVNGQATFQVSAAAATKYRVSAPSSASVGVPFSVTVTAFDDFGNVATGYRGTVHFTSSDSQARLPGNYGFKASDAGVHTFSVTLRTTGTQTITATDTANSSLSDSAQVSVNTAPAAPAIFHQRVSENTNPVGIPALGAWATDGLSAAAIEQRPSEASLLARALAGMMEWMPNGDLDAFFAGGENRRRL